MYVFDIEKKVDQLFDEVYPPSPFGDPRLNKRGYKPLVAESLGFIVPDSNARRTIKDKEYYQVDQEDFLEFATSDLPKESILSFFPNNKLLVFSFIDEGETGIATEYLGAEVKVALPDAIIARHGTGVSITARIAYKDAKSNSWVGDERERWEELVTLTYFPSDESHPSSGDTLIEWDRHVVLCPLPDDDEWRFVFADGPYAEHLRNEIRADKDGEKYRYVDDLVKASKAESEKYSVQIELARLYLCLPQYVAFMYDLVSAERVKAKSSNKNASKTSKKSRRGGVVYKIVKSIRIVRPTSENSTKIIRWSSPKRRHLVSGHWRVYANRELSGKDKHGNPVSGKTWIKQHVRGSGEPQKNLPDIAESSTQVTIHVKQTLESARDELRSKSDISTPAEVIDLEAYQSDEAKKPSNEWMARERSKLTAGLRYLVLKRDNFCCKACGASPVVTNGIQLEVDHIRPVERWGWTEISNLQTLCKTCNRGKGAR